jgi:hypothetical protein
MVKFLLLMANPQEILGFCWTNRRQDPCPPGKPTQWLARGLGSAQGGCRPAAVRDRPEDGYLGNRS